MLHVPFVGLALHLDPGDTPFTGTIHALHDVFQVDFQHREPVEAPCVGPGRQKEVREAGNGDPCIGLQAIVLPELPELDSVTSKDLECRAIALFGGQKAGCQNQGVHRVQRSIAGHDPLWADPLDSGGHEVDVAPVEAGQVVVGWGRPLAAEPVVGEKAGSYFNHGELFPDTLHVPLILGGHLVPEEYRGVRVGEPVDHLNLGRTLLDLSGLSGAEFPGSNLLRAAEPGSTGEKPLDLFAISAHGYSASIRRGRWFLLLHMQTHQGNLVVERVKHAVELYDLESDPECLEDLAGEQVEQAGILRAALIQWLAEASTDHLSEQQQTSEAEIAQLEAMGYATEETVVADKPWYDPDEK